MIYECIICGSREHVLREGNIMLCTRCIQALGDALWEKLFPGQLSPTEKIHQSEEPKSIEDYKWIK